MVKLMPQRIESDRILLSTDEASELVSVSSAYIQRLLREKRIEGIKFGPVWRVYEDSLQGFFTQPRKRGPKGPHKKDHVATFSGMENAEKESQNEQEQEAN
jgi:excisionase family DNA binding protein